MKNKKLVAVMLTVAIISSMQTNVFASQASDSDLSSNVEITATQEKNCKGCGKQ